MKIEKLEETIAIPAGVTASFDKESGLFLVKGEKAELSRKLLEPWLSVTVTGDAVTLIAVKATMREKKLLFTYKSHIKNLVKGALQGYTYTLKICSGHFPMSVAVKGRQFEVKNFIGEKVPRVITIKEGAEVKVDGESVVVTGADKEIVSQTAADIEQLTRRPGFDTRIFQDGIFIVDKDGKSMS